MPTRKQKRRREKDRRHEYEYVYVDEEGQEVEVDEPEPTEATSTKDAKAPAKAKQSQKGVRGRTMREPPEPTWSRAARRAVPWQVGIFVLVVLVLRSGPLPSRVLIGVLYGALFIPMMYLTDRMVRNRWLKQQGALPQKDKRAKRQ
jgi:Flp pilus assembly protein TadB